MVEGSSQLKISRRAAIGGLVTLIASGFVYPIANKFRSISPKSEEVPNNRYTHIPTKRLLENPEEVYPGMQIETELFIDPSATTREDNRGVMNYAGINNDPWGVMVPKDKLHLNTEGDQIRVIYKSLEGHLEAYRDAERQLSTKRYDHKDPDNPQIERLSRMPIPIGIRGTIDRVGKKGISPSLIISGEYITYENSSNILIEFKLGDEPDQDYLLAVAGERTNDTK